MNDSGGEPSGGGCGHQTCLQQVICEEGLELDVTIPHTDTVLLNENQSRNPINSQSIQFLPYTAWTFTSLYHRDLYNIVKLIQTHKFKS